MSLPWVRIDSHIASHDKILNLLSDPSTKRWQAAFAYVCSIGWSGDQGTDGFIPKVALPFVHGSEPVARLLVKYRLWEEALTGWQIRNYAERQEISVVRAGKQESRRMAAEKGNCSRWHGPDCWKQGKGCSRAVA
jgi:hypothetical protein